jgi:hypothetical protein
MLHELGNTRVRLNLGQHLFFLVTLSFLLQKGVSIYSPTSPTRRIWDDIGWKAPPVQNPSFLMDTDNGGAKTLPFSH